jgi:hypothetical protein
MRKIFFIAACFLSSSLYAQQSVELQENTPYQYNGLEYGYTITNEKSKEVKGDDLDRYEISLYVTNRSGSIRLFPFSLNTGGPEDEITVAEFSCRNATGKRLTAKNGKVNAKPWFTQVKLPDDTQKDKYKFVNAQAGYAIRNGQTIATKIIVIVPKGERPSMTCRTVYYPEF